MGSAENGDNSDCDSLIEAYREIDREYSKLTVSESQSGRNRAKESLFETLNNRICLILLLKMVTLRSFWECVTPAESQEKENDEERKNPF